MSLTDYKKNTYAQKPERLTSADCPVAWVRLFAQRGNSGPVYIGHSESVWALSGEERGEPIYPGQYIELAGVNLRDVWMDVTTDGDGAHWRATPVSSGASSPSGRSPYDAQIKVPTTLAEGQLPVLEAAQYTVPTGYNAIVTLIQANNNGSTTETVVLSLKPGSASREFIRAELLANETVEWTGDMPLEAGDVIRGKTTTTTTVDFTIHGYLVPV